MKQRSLLWRKIKNHLLNFFSILAIVFAISIMLWVIWIVISYGKEALTPSLFVNCSAPYGSITYGIGNAIVGTLLITLGAAVIAVPPALLAGIFLSEYKEYRRLGCHILDCIRIIILSDYLILDPCPCITAVIHRKNLYIAFDR